MVRKFQAYQPLVTRSPAARAGVRRTSSPAAPFFSSFFHPTKGGLDGCSDGSPNKSQQFLHNCRLHKACLVNMDHEKHIWPMKEPSVSCLYATCTMVQGHIITLRLRSRMGISSHRRVAPHPPTRQNVLVHVKHLPALGLASFLEDREPFGAKYIHSCAQTHKTGSVRDKGC